MGPRLPSMEMTESRLQAMAAARSLLDSLPYKSLDPPGSLDALKSASIINPFDHNKNALNDGSSAASRIPHIPSGNSSCISSVSQFQPFTAPWLAEVARITPSARIAEHLSPFIHSNPSLPTSLPDYYPSYPSRSFYNHPMFTSPPHPYMRDYPSPPSSSTLSLDRPPSRAGLSWCSQRTTFN